MTKATVTTSVPNSVVPQASFKVVELLGAHRPDLDKEVNQLAAPITPEDADLRERVVRSVFWNFGLNLCDWVGYCPHEQIDTAYAGRCVTRTRVCAGFPARGLNENTKSDSCFTRDVSGSAFLCRAAVRY